MESANILCSPQKAAPAQAIHLARRANHISGKVVPRQPKLQPQKQAVDGRKQHEDMGRRVEGERIP